MQCLVHLHTCSCCPTACWLVFNANGVHMARREGDGRLHPCLSLRMTVHTLCGRVHLACGGAIPYCARECDFARMAFPHYVVTLQTALRGTLLLVFACERVGLDLVGDLIGVIQGFAVCPI